MIRQVSDLYSQTEATAREQEENSLLDEQGENFKVRSWQLACPNELWCPQAVCAKLVSAQRRGMSFTVSTQECRPFAWQRLLISSLP